MKKVIRLMSVALMAIALMACAKAKTPEAAADKFLKEYQAGNYASLIDQMHFSTELTKDQKDGFAQMIQEKAGAEIQKNDGIKSYEIGEVELAEDGQSAKVNYVLRYGNDKEKADKLNMVLVDGKWMVDGGK